jgi:hypothetical protein
VALVFVHILDACEGQFDVDSLLEKGYPVWINCLDQFPYKFSAKVY